MHFKIAAEDKTNHRYSGVLAHPTSFPSPYGVGDMGEGQHTTSLIFLHMAGQHLWQVLPLGPSWQWKLSLSELFGLCRTATSHQPGAAD